MRIKSLLAMLLSTVAITWACAAPPSESGKLTRAEDLLRLNNGTVAVGIDRAKGAAITWISWEDYPKNAVNSADPGRLIQ